MYHPAHTSLKLLDSKLKSNSNKTPNVDSELASDTKTPVEPHLPHFLRHTIKLHKSTCQACDVTPALVIQHSAAVSVAGAVHYDDVNQCVDVIMASTCTCVYTALTRLQTLAGDAIATRERARDWRDVA